MEEKWVWLVSAVLFSAMYNYYNQYNYYLLLLYIIL